jgi:cytoskeletal protein RodZ
MEKTVGGRLSVKIFWLWLTLAAVVTMMCGLTYLLIQQDIRQSANYPQSQIAEDVTSATAGLSSESDGGTHLVDISTSLAPFLTTFDVNGNVVQSNAVLNGSTPVPPHGVFGYAQAQANGEDRFTWQPQTGVRVAAVLVWHAGNGAPRGTAGGSFFALSGRSLRDVEIMEGRLADDTFFVWLVALIVTFILSIFMAKAFGWKKLPENENENKKPTPQQPAPQQSTAIVPPRIVQPVIKPPTLPTIPVTSIQIVPPAPVRVPTPIVPPTQMKSPFSISNRTFPSQPISPPIHNTSQENKIL